MDTDPPLLEGWLQACTERRRGDSNCDSCRASCLCDIAISRVTVTGQLLIAVAISLLFIQKSLALTRDTIENSCDTTDGSGYSGRSLSPRAELISKPHCLVHRCLVLIRQQRWHDWHSACSSVERDCTFYFLGILYILCGCFYAIPWCIFIHDSYVYCLLWLLCTVPGSVLVLSLTLIAAFIVTRQCEAWHTCHAVPQYRILRMNSGII